MGWRTIVISKPCYLSKTNNQANIHIKQSKSNIQVPIEDISCIIIDSQKATVTSALLGALSQEGAGLVVTNHDHKPVGTLLPSGSYYKPLSRLNGQIAATKAMQKRWHQEIVKQKVLNQAATLEMHDSPIAAAHLYRLCERVRSGDPDNIEAHAARRYFECVFGTPLQRRNECLLNDALNYGYAVVRSVIAQHIVASGLEPSIGLFHHNMLNPFNLADDLIEPYRPAIDAWTHRIILGTTKSNNATLTPETKGKIIGILHEDVPNKANEHRMSISNNAQEVVRSLADGYENHRYRPLPLPSMSDRKAP
ncbi:MAG: hypothetical protein AWU57_206 [Marinobacter sp. T13-3]|nr:MAG: hypothetical protein AWU57_206 [Marinobacter sp. T13-3]